jgi:hypothetical protein
MIRGCIRRFMLWPWMPEAFWHLFLLEKNRLEFHFRLMMRMMKIPQGRQPWPVHSKWTFQRTKQRKYLLLQEDQKETPTATKDIKSELKNH